MEIKPLIIAFACEPAQGSEPGVGWNLVHSMSQIRPVWVITHIQHREHIETFLDRNAEARQRINVNYYSLPRYLDWMWKNAASLNLYYYLWQWGAARFARRLHEQHHFDITQHATYVRCWMPSAAAMIGLPFIWGPVGGGESAPWEFTRGTGWRGRLIEPLRSLVRWFCEKDPLVKLTARAANLGLAASEESAHRMRRIGVSDVQVMSAVGLVASDANDRSDDIPRSDGLLRFISIGRILHWKGFHLGLRAFAKADLPNARYVVVGDGPDRPRLERLARKLGIADRVQFTGQLPRRQGLFEIQQSDVLVHPSLHDSGAFVLLEAMDLKKPIICLDLGGPAVHVDERNGYKIAAIGLEQAIEEMAEAMTELAADSVLRLRLGENSRRRAIEEFSWMHKAREIDAAYARILSAKAAPSEASISLSPSSGGAVGVV